MRNGDEILNEEINEYKVRNASGNGLFESQLELLFIMTVNHENEHLLLLQARLTCPCCNSRVKDAVLTKCFHVFCFECVKTRYDTRQRKCPKCNAAFGANDFHRIYIG